jgi:exodeoxyribonuclease VII small subunit
MAKESNTPSAKAPTPYSEVVQRLEDVVKRLEGGDLSLEDSLKAFEEGISLVRRGEKLLGDAEKRVEQLLSEEGEDRVAPLDLPPTEGTGAARPPARPAAAGKAPPDDGEDVPF